MHGTDMNEVRGFDLLSQPAQQRLRARVADAHNNIATVANMIRAELDELDRDGAVGPDTNRQQADRAFFIAQLTYLDLLASAASQNNQPQRTRFFDAAPHRIWTRASGRLIGPRRVALTSID